MGNKRISDLPSASTPVAGDKLIINQDDGTKKLDVVDLGNSIVMGTTIRNITDLKAFDDIIDNKTIELLGYYSEGDGGGGTFFWDAASTETDNGGTVIAPTFAGFSGTGRWKRVYSGAVDVRWFGAKGDGSTDDTATIQAACSAVTHTKSVTFPKGLFLIRDTVTITPNLSGSAPGVSWYGAGSSLTFIKADPSIDWADKPCVRTGQYSRNVVVEEISFNGSALYGGMKEWHNDPTALSESESQAFWAEENTVFEITHKSSNTTVKGCKFTNGYRGVGIGYDGPAGAAENNNAELNTFENCLVQNCFYGFDIANSNNMANVFTNCSSHAIKCYHYNGNSSGATTSINGGVFGGIDGSITSANFDSLNPTTDGFKNRYFQYTISSIEDSDKKIVFNENISNAIKVGMEFIIPKSQTLNDGMDEATHEGSYTYRVTAVGSNYIKTSVRVKNKLNIIGSNTYVGYFAASLQSKAHGWLVDIRNVRFEPAYGEKEFFASLCIGSNIILNANSIMITNNANVDVTHELNKSIPLCSLTSAFTTDSGQSTFTNCLINRSYPTFGVVGTSGFIKFDGCSFGTFPIIQSDSRKVIFENCKFRGYSANTGVGKSNPNEPFPVILAREPVSGSWIPSLAFLTFSRSITTDETEGGGFPSVRDYYRSNVEWDINTDKADHYHSFDIYTTNGDFDGLGLISKDFSAIGSIANGSNVLVMEQPIGNLVPGCFINIPTVGYRRVNIIDNAYTDDNGTTWKTALILNANSTSEIVSQTITGTTPNKKKFGRQCEFSTTDPNSNISGVLFDANTIFFVSDIVWNLAPITGEPVGWVCTTQGKVGAGAVFQPFGLIV